MTCHNCLKNKAICARSINGVVYYVLCEECAMSLFDGAEPEEPKIA